MRLVLLLLGLGLALPPGWSFSICGCGLDCACAAESTAPPSDEDDGCCGPVVELGGSADAAGDPCPLEQGGAAAPSSCGDCCTLLVPAREDLSLHECARPGRMLAHAELARLEPGFAFALPAARGFGGSGPSEAERVPPWERRDLPLRL